jgi:uncharacterized protein YndB with AHSA1/START domain
MSPKPTPEGTKVDLTVTRVFDAPVERVWQAWVEPPMVMKWWGPTGFTSPSAEMDFREGGSSLVCMRAPAEYGGQDMYNTWTYTKIVPLERIEYIFRFADKGGRKVSPAELGIPAGVPEDGHHVVTFKDLGGGRTEMTMTEHGYTSDLAYETSRLGLEQCLDKMAAALIQAGRGGDTG